MRHTRRARVHARGMGRAPRRALDRTPGRPHHLIRLHDTIWHTRSQRAGHGASPAPREDRDMLASKRGFGLAGEYPIESIRAAARAAEAHGYHSFWLSQPLGDPSLPKLADVATRTERLTLGVGALPLTDHAPRLLATEIQRLGLPLDRFLLGIGSGTARGALDRTRTAVEELRQLLDVKIVVAPLGPKMCYLAGQLADGVLLNWLTPAYARTSAAWIREGAESMGRPAPTILPRLRPVCARRRLAPAAGTGMRPLWVVPALCRSLQAARRRTDPDHHPRRRGSGTPGTAERV